METNWQLTGIYPSVDSTEFKSDLLKYKELIGQLNTWAREALTEVKDSRPERAIYEYIVMKNRLMSYEKLSTYVSLALSADTGSEKLASLLDSIEQLEAEAAEHEALFCQYLKGIENIDEVIGANRLLKSHSFFIKEKKTEGSHTLDPRQELTIAKMKTTGSALWKKQWEQLTSNIEVGFEYNGTDYKEPLSAVRNMAYSNDRGLRLAAYKAELKAYEGIKTAAAFSLNGIKGEVIALCKLRGYSSPLDMTLEQSRLTREVLEAMWQAVKEALPALTRYFNAKAEFLGYKDKKLPFYELFAPVGQASEYSLEKARDTVTDCFYSFSQEMGDFASNAFKNRWLDLLPRKGKVGGAFCEAIHSVRESRILTNFSGSFNDVITIAHELGHAYHDTRLFDAEPLNSFYPMPIAETASTFCETLLISRGLERAGDDEALNIIENDLSGIMQTLSDIYSRFLFEDWLFRLRQEGTLSADALCSLMLKAQKEAYCHTLNEEYMHRYMWVCKPHYYDGDFNYYNFPYAFGMLLSKALYAKYKKMGDSFAPLYSSLLGATGANSLEAVAAIAGFDLKDKNFWKSGLRLIEDEVEDFLNRLKKR